MIRKRISCLRRVLPIALLVLAVGLVWTAQAAEPKVVADHAAKMTKGLAIFKDQVRPILVKRCVRCHGDSSVESGFDINDRDRLLRGGDSGPAILVGNSKDSSLYKLITHAREPHMPHKRAKLPTEAIASIAAWIDLGAPYDAPLVAGKTKGPVWTTTVVPDEARRFWSFQPLRRVEPPAVKDVPFCKTPVDRFLLAKLEAAKLKPNRAVERRQLVRRAYFDLIGLPPTLAELEAALKDQSADWFEKIVDRLLASPHYGERWGRHWLDLARYAESHGFEHDTDRPTAYHFRDFVIRALNDDLPYHTFVKWQIAGDEYEPDNPLALAATGFLAAGVHSTQITKKEVEKDRYDELDDMTQTVSTAMLGLTIGCARCHDHKFDPFPQRDYYRMLSTFTTTVRSEVELKPLPEDYRKAKAAFDREHAPLAEDFKKFEAEALPARLADWEKSPAAKTQKIPAPVAKLLALADRNDAQKAEVLKWFRTIDPEWKKRNQKVQDHLKKAPKSPKMLISTEGLPAVRLFTQGGDYLSQTHFLRRGDPDQKEGVAAQGFLQVLMPAAEQQKRWQTPPPAGWRTSYRRRALAEWITDVDQGGGRLLARVIANRLWQHHMGRGLVATPSDFGVRGEAPTHPELLDWLATELIRNGWHLKPIHKLLMTSAFYQIGSQRDEAKRKIDPENKLFWRRPSRRLEAEVIRDSLLAISGTLDPRQFGPGTLDESSRRRSIYFTVKRSKLIPMMTVFDAPDALGGIGDRPTTTIAPQALLLMNNPHVRGWAKSMARRIAPEAKMAVEDAVKAGYLTALSRPPTKEELEDSTAFVKRQADRYKARGQGDGRELALADFCQVLMGLNEFVYVD